MSTRINLISLAAGTCLLASAQSAMGGAHTWIVNEVFSSPDGLIQYIELKECCGMNFEFGVIGGTLQSSLHSVTISGVLSSGTANRTLLIATPGFAALPGAPTPDMVVPAGMVPFFNPAGDSIVRPGYPAATLTFGAMPADCAFSIHAGNIIAPNTPMNYSYATRWMDACTPCPGDFVPPGGSGGVDVLDLLGVITEWGPCDAPPAEPCVADCNSPAGDGVVNVLDLLAVITNWGACD